MNVFFRLFACTALLLTALLSAAANAELQVSLDNRSPLPGQHLTLSLSVLEPAPTILALPANPRALGDFALLAQQGGLPIKTAQGWRSELLLTLAAPNTYGEHHLGNVLLSRVTWNDASPSADTALARHTELVPIEVPITIQDTSEAGFSLAGLIEPDREAGILANGDSREVELFFLATLALLLLQPLVLGWLARSSRKLAIDEEALILGCNDSRYFNHTNSPNGTRIGEYHGI